MPPIEYFALINTCSEINLESCENYQKQSYRNRARVVGANNLETLIVPVKHQGRHQRPIKEVLIDYSQSWVNKHIRTLQSVYGKAPFFEYFIEDILQILRKKPPRLIDLNLELLTKCLELIGLDRPIRTTRVFKQKYAPPFLDARSVIHPKKTINHLYSYKAVTYQQIFGKVFAPEMSIVDLIFCQGPRSLDIIENSELRIHG